jgi:hypothetical protein
VKSRSVISRCCCDEEDCGVYVPCCIRDLRISLEISATMRGGNTFVYVSEFKLTNHCNDQESVDWSSWERAGDASGGTTITHEGRPNQGCTFGIDVTQEHLFCLCSGTTHNFTAELTVCNPQDNDVTVTARQPSMAVGFSNRINEPLCPLELLYDVRDELWYCRLEILLFGVR